MNEQMPAYMTAKQAYIALENKIQYLNRSTIPKLPPLPGYEGYEEYQGQVKLWRDWIEFEKTDPNLLKEDKPDGSTFKARVLFVYKIALMTLRFEPQMWLDAAQFCLDNDLKEDGEKMLDHGLTANPESCLLAFAEADRIETLTVGENDPAERGRTVRQPYNKLIDALYDLLKQTKERSEREVAEIEERYTKEGQDEVEKEQQRERSPGSDDDQPDDAEGRAKDTTARREAEIKEVKERYEDQLHELRRIITSAWIGLIRAMRRIQGKGKPGSADLPGSRGILSETRRRGHITSDLYVQCALTEWYCYKDPAALRLFDKGLTLYPTDENFALEYIKHLIAQTDLTNARTIFEKAVSRLEKDPKTVQKAKPLYAYFHSFESKYGELAQVQKLEARMRDLFPEDPALRIFAHRFEYENALAKRFDPTTVTPIISPGTQLRPAAAQSIEQDFAPGYLNPAPLGGLSTSSPKRPFGADSSLDGPPRKVARGESPLKGAAGRRLASTRQGGTPLQTVATAASVGGNWPVPQHINFLLSVLPNARYTAALTPRIDPVGVVNIMRGVNLQPAIWGSANLRNAGPGLMDPRWQQPAPLPGQGLPAPPPSVLGRPPPHLGQPPLPMPPQGYGPPPMSGPPPPQGYYPPPPHMQQPPQGFQYQTPVNGMYTPSPYSSGGMTMGMTQYGR
jgi:cleavage stimulation factor subunit 3